MARSGSIGRSRLDYSPAEGRVRMQGRVPKQVLEMAHARAEAMGVTVSAYLEQLVSRDETGPDGRPVWAPAPQPTPRPRRARRRETREAAA